MHYLQIALTAKNLSYGFVITPLLNKMSEISQRFEAILRESELKMGKCGIYSKFT